MYTVLIVIIYLTFISLGLPDTLLGSAWSVMYTDLAVPLSYMGIITMIISAGTVVSSLFAGVLTKRIGTGGVVAISVFLTAAAMFGFAYSGTFWHLCLWAVPYGLGAGAIDSSLNNYVALHYSSRHMSWLHCFWGVGTIISPIIMSWSLTVSSWHGGYFIVAAIQTVIVIVLLCSIRLWKGKKTAEPANEPAEDEFKPNGLWKAVHSKGAIAAALAFLVYSAVECTAGYWASSYLVSFRGVEVETAAACASLYYIGITAGRFISGFIANKIGDRNFVRTGIGIMAAGLVFLLIPVGPVLLPCAGLVILGLGSAPVYPCIIHETPDNFGRENSQSMISIQVSVAYIGTTFMPLAFGFLADNISIGLFPLYLLLFTLLLILFTELVNRARRHREKSPLGLQ